MAPVRVDVQARGWLRSDVSLRAVVVFVQAYARGRIIDDITDDPVDPADERRLISTVMSDVLSSPSG